MVSLYRKYKRVPEKTDSEKFYECCCGGDIAAAQELIKKFDRIKQRNEVKQIVQYKEPTVS
jgi:hypothetical protein